MAEAKTKPTKESVKDFLNKIPDKNRRQDCKVILELMADITGAKAEMWGPSIIGFGRYLYKYKGGREGEWILTGFSPRKSDLTLYIMTGFEAFPDLMKQLGKHRTGKSCLYIKNLDDIDLSVLRKLIERSVRWMSENSTDKKSIKKETGKSQVGKN